MDQGYHTTTEATRAAGALWGVKRNAEFFASSYLLTYNTNMAQRYIYYQQDDTTRKIQKLAESRENS